MGASVPVSLRRAVPFTPLYMYYCVHSNTLCTLCCTALRQRLCQPLPYCSCSDNPEASDKGELWAERKAGEGQGGSRLVLMGWPGSEHTMPAAHT